MVTRDRLALAVVRVPAQEHAAPSGQGWPVLAGVSAVSVSGTGQADELSATEAVMTTWDDRLIIRILMTPAMIVACLCWIALGVVSPKLLGRVLVKTGSNLMEYDF